MIHQILLLFLYSIATIYLFIPIVFILVNLFLIPVNIILPISKISHILSVCMRFHYLLITITIFSVITLSTIILSLHEIAVKSMEMLFIDVDENRLMFNDIYKFYSIIALFLSQLLLPITTLLMTLIWYLAMPIHRFNVALLILGIWFTIRIGFTVVLLTDADLRMQDHIAGRAVFGSFAGLWICIVLSIGSAIITGLVLRDRHRALRYLTITACLSPLIVLMWGVLEISVEWLAIDIPITAFLFGWMLSAFNRKPSVSRYVGHVDQVSGSCDTGKKVRDQSKSWVNTPPTTISVPLVLWRWLVAGIFVLMAAFIVIIFKWVLENLLGFSIGGIVGSWAMTWIVAVALGTLAFATAARYERWSWVIVGGFALVAIIPAIVLKWAFHGLIGLRLDGAAWSWMTIWAVAFVLGSLTFLAATRYEHQNRALQISVAAFSCAFAIMILNWGTEFDYKLSAYINDIGVVFTWPIFGIGILGLIVTVVTDNSRWSSPFWACYLFIYIFVHSMAGSGYVKDLSKLDLFSWINMSVIVFVFLFAIPAYFASDRCQERTLETEDHSESAE